MLLVVFGAGASFDSVDPRLHSGMDREEDAACPPLANRLFDERYKQFLDQFPVLSGILHQLRNLPSDVGLEQRLEQLQSDGTNYSPRLGQLVAVRFYLQRVLQHCGDTWTQRAGHATNFVTLFDRIDRWRHDQGNRVAIVTFNYDNMVEHALSRRFGMSFNDLADWIRGPNYLLFKLHGSVNWTHPVINIDPPTADALVRAAEGHTLDVVENVFNLRQPGTDPNYGYPAVAIPVVTKTGLELPAEHISALMNVLPEVDRILVVGWRGMDHTFLHLLRDRIDAGSARVLVVAGGESQSLQVLQNIDEFGISLPHGQASGGEFSGLVGAADLEQFLSD
jgi:hypothetical protein